MAPRLEVPFLFVLKLQRITVHLLQARVQVARIMSRAAKTNSTTKMTLNIFSIFWLA